MMKKPTVAIVGRPNVGKSTLFNRLIGERISIVQDEPGVTRDRIYGTTEWNGRPFHLIDTGGLEVGSEDHILRQVRAQAELAIDEAEVILFIVDGKTGITSTDEEIAPLLFRSGKKVVLAVNKIDHPNQLKNAIEFYSLGFGEPFPVSGEHGTGLGDLLDEVVKQLPLEEGETEEEDVIRVALIGRPNVGKSSLVNAILGEERVIVSEVAGTTRDAIDTPFTYEEQKYILIDTAGMRKRGKVYEATEKYSVLRALSAIERSDVVLVVLNGEEGIIEQDKKIAGYAHQAGRGIVILVNKWDQVEKDDKTHQEMTKQIRNAFQFLDYAPILFVSAKTKQRMTRVLPLVKEVADNHAMRIPTPVLNDLIADAVAITPPPSHKGKRLRVSYATQAGVKPPTIIIFVNDRQLMHFSYERYLENTIRKAFPLEGTPIRIFTRNKAEAQ